MKYDILMFDVDDTLLDFESCEYPAFEKALGKGGITATREDFEVYKLINKELWQNFEAGIYTKGEILTLRFDLLFVQLGKFGDAAQVCHDYLVAMGEFIDYEKNAKTILETVKDKATMVIVTNGAKLAQDGKIRNTGLDSYFDHIFISDAAGCHKPQKAFFDMVANEVAGFDKSRALIIGDGLGSDILGGNNYGIDTCWYNKWNAEAPEDIRPTYEITDMKELITLL